jgi:hypothetical protein
VAVLGGVSAVVEGVWVDKQICMEDKASEVAWEDEGSKIPEWEC